MVVYYAIMRTYVSVFFSLLIASVMACGGDGGEESSVEPGQGGAGTAGSSGKAGGGAGGGGISGAGAGGISGAGTGGNAGAGGDAGEGGSTIAGKGGEAGQGGSTTAGMGGKAGVGGNAGQGGDAGQGGSTIAGAGGDAGEGGSSTAGAGGEAGASGAALCPSGVMCGAGVCCATGDECVFGACLPVCASSVRCGASQDCCGAGEVCVADICTAPKSACKSYADCEEDEFCEPTLEKCLPQPGEPACIFKPPVGQFEPVLEWSWESTSIKPTFTQVINTPLVFDLDKDGIPDVVFVTSEAYDAKGPAYLRALDGKTGKEKWAATSDVYKDAYRVQPRSVPALGDMDGDGFVEIVALKMGGGVIAFEHDGTFKWTSKLSGGAAHNQGFSSGAVALADLEGDGTVEIITAGVVLESNGTVRFDKGALAGSNNNTYGAVSIVADVDGDGKQELITGKAAYRYDGTVLWNNGEVDGYPAIADLDGDGSPELVVVSNGNVRVQNAVTGVVLATLKMPGNGAGGPPTIAQFDGVGGQDFASANGSAYSVYTYDAATKKISVLWSKPTQDLSSNRTGSTVFDFEGDGKAEVIYNDECYLRVYSGTTGDVLLQQENSSATIHEYPVVADVDGDNNTEIIVAANKSGGCPYNASKARQGIFVYGDKSNRWVRTRRLWNQHSYHVTNINNDGSIPKNEPLSWGPKGFNNYRQSTQGKASYNAADLQVSLAALVDQCPSTVVLQATIKNGGSLGVPAGVLVSFYEGTPPNGTSLGLASTSFPLLPGASEVVTLPIQGKYGESSYYVVVDADVSGIGSINECIENNNTAIVHGELCGKP